MSLLAARQHLVVARWQMAALGITDQSIGRAAHGGRLHRTPFRGAYSLVPALTREATLMAAQLGCGPKAATTHLGAAHIYDIRRYDRGKPHVTVPTSGARQRANIHIHTSRSLGAAVQEHNGFRLTTPERTLTDIEPLLTDEAFERALARAERLKLVDGYELGHRPVYTASQNERAFLALVARHGLPRPEVNVDMGRLYEADFLWRPQRLVVEIDAYFTHGDPRTFETDRLKDEYLALELGLTVRRITDQRLHRRPGEVAAVVRRALGGGPRR